MKLNALGRHILAEFFNCDREILNDSGQVEILMKKAALACGATIVSSVFHTFNPHGVSGVVVIAESHLAIHTWPEYGYAAVDVFTCGNLVDPNTAIQSVQNSVRADKMESKEFIRGEIKDQGVIVHKPNELQLT
ncbi:MAG: S-adenosylmethionine decarboxylase proenzyme [Calditrichae bacterium]|nr:S-adenosylmethionine decarboxylase proenzyme [Calditrichia bacterium]